MAPTNQLGTESAPSYTTPSNKKRGFFGRLNRVPASMVSMAMGGPNAASGADVKNALKEFAFTPVLPSAAEAYQKHKQQEQQKRQQQMSRLGAPGLTLPTEEVMYGIGDAFTKFFDEMQTPAGIALAIAYPQLKAGTVLRLLADTAVGVAGLKFIIDNDPIARTAIERGDHRAAAEAITNVATGVTMLGAIARPFEIRPTDMQVPEVRSPIRWGSEEGYIRIEYFDKSQTSLGHKDIRGVSPVMTSNPKKVPLTGKVPGATTAIVKVLELPVGDPVLERGMFDRALRDSGININDPNSVRYDLSAVGGPPATPPGQPQINALESFGDVYSTKGLPGRQPKYNVRQPTGKLTHGERLTEREKSPESALYFKVVGDNVHASNRAAVKAAYPEGAATAPAAAAAAVDPRQIATEQIMRDPKIPQELKPQIIQAIWSGQPAVAPVAPAAPAATPAPPPTPSTPVTTPVTTPRSSFKNTSNLSIGGKQELPPISSLISRVMSGESVPVKFSSGGRTMRGQIPAEGYDPNTGKFDFYPDPWPEGKYVDELTGEELIPQINIEKYLEGGPLVLETGSKGTVAYESSISAPSTYKAPTDQYILHGSGGRVRKIKNVDYSKEEVDTLLSDLEARGDQESLGMIEKIKKFRNTLGGLRMYRVKPLEGFEYTKGSANAIEGGVTDYAGKEALKIYERDRLALKRARLLNLVIKYRGKKWDTSGLEKAMDMVDRRMEFLDRKRSQVANPSTMEEAAKSGYSELGQQITGEAEVSGEAAFQEAEAARAAAKKTGRDVTGTSLEPRSKEEIQRMETYDVFPDDVVIADSWPGGKNWEGRQMTNRKERGGTPPTPSTREPDVRSFGRNVQKKVPKSSTPPLSSYPEYLSVDKTGNITLDKRGKEVRVESEYPVGVPPEAPYPPAHREFLQMQSGTIPGKATEVQFSSPPNLTARERVLINAQQELAGIEATEAKLGFKLRRGDELRSVIKNARSPKPAPPPIPPPPGYSTSG